MAANCTIPQAPNGENSKLYQGLHKICRNNALANYLYATYVSKNIGDLMERDPNNPIKRNKQGEHTAPQVYKFLHAVDIVNDIKSKAVAGIDPNTGGLKVYTDYNEAVADAIDFNKNHKGRIAKIVPKGQDFTIITSDINSDNLLYKEELEEQQKLWQQLTQEFSNAGIDINDFDFMRDVANPMHFSNFLNYLDIIKNGQNKNLSKKDLHALLAMGSKLPQVQNMISRWGNLEDAATKVFNAYNGGTVTQTTMQFIENTLNACKQYPLSVYSLRRNLEQQYDTVIQNSENLPIKKQWEDIAQKVGMRGKEAKLIGEKVNSLTDAAGNMILALQRQLNNLKKYGNRSQLKSVEDKIIDIQNKIQQQQHYTALLESLRDIDGLFNIADGLMRGLSNNGNMMEFIKQRAEVFNTINNLLNNYSITINALCNLSSIQTIEVNLTDQDKTTLQNTARDLRDKMNKLRLELLDRDGSLGQQAVLDLMFEIMGTETPNGIAVGDLLDLQNKSTMTEWLYSMGRSTQPLFALMGTVIQDARDKRDLKKNEISRRIARMNRKLKKSGSDSRFMYNKFGYIISDIDWIKYNRARNAKMHDLTSAGLQGLEFQQALRQWEDANTEDRIVDNRAGVKRTERVPDKKYRQNRELANLTQAQRTYYDQMMQLKGELGTMLPTYAQNHYLPPQVRNTTLDILGDCIKGRLSARDTWRTWRDKMKLFRIREDDTDYAQNALSIEGENYKVSQGTSKGTKARDIPVFYMNKLKNQSELLKDFSSAMELFACTATNYEQINNVKSIVEMMQAYIEDRGFVPSKDNDVEAAYTNAGVVAKQLGDIAKKQDLLAILDGYLDKNLYGVEKKDTGLFSRIVDYLLKYTSIARLASNIKGWVNNGIVGEYQTILEAMGGRFFNLADYAWSIGYMLGNNRLTSVSALTDWLTNNTNSTINLLVDLFDPCQEQFDKNGRKRYYKNMSRRILSAFNPLYGYSSGEYMFHVHVMLSMLHNAKVYRNGKQVRVLGTGYGNSIFEKVTEDGNTHLKIKDGVTVDKDGKIPVTMEGYIMALKGKIRECNQNLHGSMNKEDKGLIAQKVVGRSALQFRQWMIEMFSNRFRSTHWSASTKMWETGFQKEIAKYYINLLKSLMGKQVDDIVRLRDIKDEEERKRFLGNRRKFWYEQLLIAGLTVLGIVFGSPQANDDWWMRMGRYQLQRLKMDANLTSVLGVWQELKTIINQPVAAISTINGLLYPILGIRDLWKETKDGENAWWAGVQKYTIPFKDNVEKTIDFENQDNVFTIFNNKYN